MSGAEGKGRQGFASMPPEQLRAIASAGGKAAQATGKAHLFTADEAREAGAKGGAKIAADREHMAAIGRKGAAARVKAIAARRAAEAAKDDEPTRGRDAP